MVRQLEGELLNLQLAPLELGIAFYKLEIPFGQLKLQR